MRRAAPLAATALLLGGCVTQPPAPVQGAARSPCNKLLPAKPAPAEIEQRRTRLYRYAICYPRLGPAGDRLTPTLHRWADQQLETFLKVAGRPRPQPWTYELLIDFRVVARGKGFTSVLARGYRYTGGAHGMPVLAAFTLSGGQIVRRPDALFGKPARARAALSRYVRRVFGRRAGSGDTAWCFKDSKWLRKGTAPTAANYAIATFTAAQGRATGLRVYFTPYQVAPYACGIQAVDVPAKIFRRWLNSAHKPLFAEPGH